MTSPARQPSFDARPLWEPVDTHAVRAFAADLRARRTTGSSVSTVFVIVFAIVAVIILIPMIGMALMVLSFSGGDGSWLAVIPLVLFGGAGLLIAAVAWNGWRNRRVSAYRLSRFAQANGMTYEARVEDPPLPGMIFSLGRSRMSTDLVRGSAPRFVEFGNFQYTTGSGKDSNTYHWGYVAVKLDVPLPNIVLDAKGNNGFGTNLPAAFERRQRLSLEGSFDDHFTLYCPEGYERDALYLFTPDIMARFIDSAAQLDVEIVDDWMFLYTQRKATTLDPDTWAWLFGAVGALITKLDQWARWRDERLPAENVGAAQAATPTALPFAPPVGMLTPPPGVAHEGRRLKRRFSWIPIVIAVVFGIVWIWMRTQGVAGG